MYVKSKEFKDRKIYTKEEIYPYQLLAASIIRNACRDYCAILNRQALNLKYYSDEKRRKDNIEKRNIENFFYSHYFTILSNSDPEWILGELRKKYKHLDFSEDCSIV